MKILAIDIGGTSLKMSLSDIAGQLTDFNEYPSESKQGGKHLIKRLFGIIKADYPHFDALGISTAGQVDSEAGSIIFANENIPGYTGMNLKQIFEAEFDVPVKVENDVNAAALGELHFGVGQLYSNFLCLTYGTGIGGAIVMNSKIYKGLNGSAAEFGHMMIHPSGEKCNCGNQGCYEVYASTTALVKMATELNADYSSGREIFRGIESGDLALKEVLENWVCEISYGLVSLIHIFNPPAIIIGGGIMEQDSLVPFIAAKVKQQIMKSFVKLDIVKASLGNKAGLLGAVSLHIRK